MKCLDQLLANYPPSVALSGQQNRDGYQAFNNITRWDTVDYQYILQELRRQEERQFYINSIFFFTPVVLIISAVLWADNFTGNIDQSSQIFYYTLAFVILYGASIYYRYRVSQVYDSYQKSLLEAASRDQITFQNSVNRWIQGLEAASCSITSFCEQ